MDGDPSCGITASHERLRDAKVSKNLEAAGVDYERARLVGTVDQPVDDPRPDPKRVEGCGQHQPCRPRSHYQDVNCCSFVYRHMAIVVDRATIL